MHTFNKIFSATLIGLFSLSGHALTNEQVKSEKQAIDNQYKTALTRCKSLSDNAKDICEKEAKGNEDIARAELAVRENSNETTQYKARMARAEAAFEVAKERCDDQGGNAKGVCQKDAKAVYEKAKGDAKVQRAEATPSATLDRKAADVSNARKDAAQNTREAQYKAAAERCDALTGAQQDACMDEAKAQFPK